MSFKQNHPLAKFIKKMLLYAISALYQISFGLFLRISYNMKLSRDSDKIPKGAFVLLGNHCNNFDGLLLQCLIFRPVCFVITDTVFNNRFLRAILTWVGYIPKRKFSSDVQTVRKIVFAADRGGIIGIFPEGMRSWDGHTMPVSPATFKLIRLLKIPVVTARIAGSYLSGPRWADTRRRGRVEIKLSVLLNAQDIRRLSLAEVTEKISAALAHDEAVWESQKHIRFRGKKLAEGFERLLYICPECGLLGTIRTQEHRVYCSACGAEYVMDACGHIRAVRGFLPADNASALNVWQYEHFKEYIASHAGETLMCDEGARLARSEYGGAMREIAAGTLSLTRGALIIQNLSFPLSEITGVALNFKSGVMFRHGGCEYLIRFDNPRVSVYKWGCAFEIITGSPVG